jgi:hypothetical protein
VGSECLLTVTTVSVLLICALLAVAFDVAEVRTRRGDRIAKRRSTPEQRADALLKEWLSPEQRFTLHKYGFFEVRGSHTGKCYRIRRGRNMNIYEVGTGRPRVAIWCFGPVGHLPLGDVMLAQKLALRPTSRPHSPWPTVAGGNLPGGVIAALPPDRRGARAASVTAA